MVSVENLGRKIHIFGKLSLNRLSIFNLFSKSAFSVKLILLQQKSLCSSEKSSPNKRRFLAKIRILKLVFVHEMGVARELMIH